MLCSSNNSVEVITHTTSSTSYIEAGDTPANLQSASITQKLKGIICQRCGIKYDTPKGYPQLCFTCGKLDMETRRPRIERKSKKDTDVSKQEVGQILPNV